MLDNFDNCAKLIKITQLLKFKHESKKSKLKLKEYKDNSGNQSTSLNLSEKFDSDEEDGVIFIGNVSRGFEVG